MKREHTLTKGEWTRLTNLLRKQDRAYDECKQEIFVVLLTYFAGGRYKELREEVLVFLIENATRVREILEPFDSTSVVSFGVSKDNKGQK